MNIPRWSLRLLLVVTAGTLAATGPIAAQVASVAPASRLPPAGIPIAAADRAELAAGAAALRSRIDRLVPELKGTPTLARLLPDVEIYHKAVDWALRHDEFFDAREVDVARRLLATGQERAAQLRRGQPAWLEATGLVVRGHRSKLDGSYQPYGLLVPPGWKRTNPGRLQVWLLGRGEKRTELAFMADRETQRPDIVPPHTLVVVPYGRYCNATKFAGEVDVFEVMEAVREENVIDPQRITVAGFSMGGASTWHLAAHHPGLWAAASPGAGFAETSEYTNALAPGKEPPTWWEQKLWKLYDATAYAANFHMVPVIAYHGELDRQKQASEVMARALQAEGLTLERLVGPGTDHRYHPDSKAELIRRLEALATRGRPLVDPVVQVTTHTLRYPGRAWIKPRGLERHWERADVHAKLDGDTLAISTRNVTALQFPAWARTADVDGQRVALPWGTPEEPVWLSKADGKWQVGAPAAGLRKDHGLTGPIDDAFMDPFLFVRPTGQAWNAAVGSWAAAEMGAARKLWRDLFRGDAPIKDDTAVSDEDIAQRNLVLWGDPASNRVLARIVARLPLTWNARSLVFRAQTYDAQHHAPVLIFPNPLNPRRYVVLNSGIDFRAHASGTNALQIPKLPDYAIVDLRESPGPRWPGKIVDAGFFDERWAPPR